MMRLVPCALAGLLVMLLSLSAATASDADRLKAAAPKTSESQKIVQQDSKMTSRKKEKNKQDATETIKKKNTDSNTVKAPQRSAVNVKKSVETKKTSNGPDKSNGSAESKEAVKQTAAKETETKNTKAAIKKPSEKKSVTTKKSIPSKSPAPQPDAAGQYNASVEQQIVGLVNNVRTENGLQPLRVKSELQNFARQWSRQQFKNGAMSHGMVNFSRNTVAGQNVAYAKGDVDYYGWNQIWSAQATMDGWMRSPAHRANILKPQYTYIGVGVVYGEKNGGSDGWVFFTQDFSD